MAGFKILKPPFVWIGGNTKQLVEDRQYKRWTVPQLRAMKNGTYNWKTHEEKSV